MKIIEHVYQWVRPLTRRRRKPKASKWHHIAAEKATPQDIDRWHKKRKPKPFIGIGYHLYIRRDGSIHRGRPLWAVGSHTLGFNQDIGIALEGNLDQAPPTPAQMAAASWIQYVYLPQEFGRVLPAFRHSDHAATACPGRFMPWPIPLPATHKFRITVPSNYLTRRRIRAKMVAATGYRWHDGPRGTLQTTGDAKALAHIRRTSPYRVYWTALP